MSVDQLNFGMPRLNGCRHTSQPSTSAALEGLEWFGGASFGFLKLSDLQIFQILRCPGWVCNHTWFEEERLGGWESGFEAFEQGYAKRPSGAF